MSEENNTNHNFFNDFLNSITGKTAEDRKYDKQYPKALENAKNVEPEVKTDTNAVPATQEEPKNQPEKPVKQKTEKPSKTTEDLKTQDNSPKENKTVKSNQPKTEPELSATAKKKISMINLQLNQIAEREKAQLQQRAKEHTSNLEEAANLNIERREIIAQDEQASKISKDFLASAEKLSHSPKEV